MLRALDLDADEHSLSSSYKRNKFIVSIRRENRSKLFTTLRKMQDNQEEEETAKEEEGVDRVLSKEDKEDIVRFNKKEVKQEDFPLLRQMIDSQQPIEQLEGIIGIRKLVDSKDFSLNQYIKPSTIDKLLSFLDDSQHLQVKYEAASIFASIASNTTPLNKYITSCKCIPTFIDLLKLGDHFINQVMWFFANMVCDNTAFRNKLFNQGAARILIELLEKMKGTEFEKIVALTIANICRGDPLPQYDQVKELMVTLCFALAQGRIEDMSYFADCLWGISYHVQVRKAEIAKVIETNINIKCIQILNTQAYHQEDTLIMPCIRIVSRMSQGGVEIVQYLLENNALEALEKMLYHESVVIRRQACLSLSNIAASNFNHVNLLLQNNCLINRLKEMIERDEITVRYEIAAFYCNMCMQKQLDLDVLIIQLEIVECFKDLLTSSHEEKIVSLMDMLELPLRLSQLKERDGCKQSLLALQMQRKGILLTLEELQYHPNEAIYNAASTLLSRYFHNFIDDPLARRPFDDELIKLHTLKSL